jgi:hypothetical protein
MQSSERAVADIYENRIRATVADQQPSGAAAVERFVLYKFAILPRTIRKQHPGGLAEMRRHFALDPVGRHHHSDFAHTYSFVAAYAVSLRGSGGLDLLNAIYI